MGCNISDLTQVGDKFYHIQFRVQRLSHYRRKSNSQLEWW